MKAIVALALFGLASADEPDFSTYVTYNSATASCEIAAGYSFLFFGSSASYPTSPANTILFSDAFNPDSTDPTTATKCLADADSITYQATCASGYSADGLTDGELGVFGFVTGTSTNWETTSPYTTVAPPTTIDATPYNFATGTTFTCVADSSNSSNSSNSTNSSNTTNTTCAYTCTGNCASSSGSIAEGASFSTICSSKNIAVADITTCPTGGSSNTTSVVCTNSSDDIPADQWFDLAEQYPGYSIPQYCGCLEDPVCPDTITCSQCYLDCTQRRAAPARAATVAAGVFCPSTTTTIAEMKTCFHEGACAGAIQPGDTCVYGPVGAGTNPCPTCDSSKKGLLGLLGLLGLIPLLLCLLLCSLLLLCIRRKKTERDVHFATFDAGAPPVLAPAHVHEVPIAHTHSHVHHSTYVGPPHCDTGVIAY